MEYVELDKQLILMLNTNYYTVLQNANRFGLNGQIDLHFEFLTVYHVHCDILYFGFLNDLLLEALTTALHT